MPCMVESGPQETIPDRLTKTDCWDITAMVRARHGMHLPECGLPLKRTMGAKGVAVSVAAP